MFTGMWQQNCIFSNVQKRRCDSLERVLICLVIILIAVILYFSSALIEYYKRKRLHNLVAWTVIKSKPAELLVYSHDQPLWSYLEDAQSRLHVPQDHCITSDKEWEFVREILDAYQKDLVQSYFKNHLLLLDSKCVLSGEDYFMVALHTYLSTHQCDYKFLSYNMHEKRLEYKSYGSWGGALYDAAYSLSDFAVAYHKVLYLAYLYCKKSNVINPSGSLFTNEAHLEEILNTKTIKISRV